jgi:hypothetical protein
MNEVVIRPLRFSDDIQAMRAFLETLGLRSRIESERGGWVDMVAGRGMVALHDAATSSTGGKAGDTRLSFEADDIDELMERLLAAGYQDTNVWDEAYGRVLSVAVPGNLTIWVDERNDDLYGYKLHDAYPDSRWSVKPFLIGAEQPTCQRFLEVLGSADDVYYGPPAPEFGVRPDLQTTEDLDEVLRRLTATGYEARLDEDGLTATDPDGELVRVHR